jgi:hypothetical protein
MNFKILLVVLMLGINSCSLNGQEIVLPGKIAVELGVGTPNDTCIIYEGDKKYKFTLKKNGLRTFSGIAWLNKEDAFLCMELIENDERTKFLQSNIIKIDTKGNILDTIFQIQYPKSAGLLFVSGKDNRLLFRSSVTSENASVIEIFNPQESIVIMDFKTRQILRTIDPIGALNLQLEESPWLPDENRFVYSITNANQVDVEGESLMREANKPGIYLYDIDKAASTLLLPDATHAICSPLHDAIAFMKDKKVGIFKLEDKSIKWLYNFTKSSVMHWTPDGNYIYILDYPNNGGRAKEKLIRVSDGEEVPFKTVKHGYYSFTWK